MRLASNKTDRRERVAHLLERALGPRWRARTARALDLDPGAVRRMFAPPKGRDDAPSAALEAAAEFLVSTPRAGWPDRWRD